MNKNDTIQHATWAQEFRGMMTSHWRAKMLAVVVAFCFWYMVKQQIRTPTARQKDFIEEHSLGNAAGIGQTRSSP